MAATLSAEEEQVGRMLLSYLCFFNLNAPVSALPGGMLAFACAHRSECEMHLLGNGRESGNIVSISCALLLSLHHCQILSPAAELM